ncbi:MAG: ABC transporter ATP-binding protein [Acidimicrobiales bacterium]
MGTPAITIRGLRKAYGAVEAVRGIDFDVAPGEVVAFLGPNGAGKTTTVEILEGYRTRTGGEVRVLGVDPARPTTAWRARLGIVLQTCRLQPELTVSETLGQHAAYYPHPRPVAETVELVGLGDQADRRVGRLSGGQQRRVDVALALIGDPELLFLDEPTTGFDPSARRAAWALVHRLRELGKTVFLTTHYLDEAEVLADRVVIIRAGRIVAAGRPAELGRALSRPPEIRFRLPAGVAVAALPEGLAGEVSVDGGAVRLRTAAVVPALHALTGWALDHGVDLADLTVARARLEEVYLDLTGGEAGQ